MFVPSENLESGGVGVLGVLGEPEPAAGVELDVEWLGDGGFGEDGVEGETRSWF
ncbi:MAG: hypothetical protein P8J87_06050 [Verrucomicrobiales bacterium]|nr:hypothetical protein [Verrucomicrobiales bacterium]